MASNVEDKVRKAKAEIEQAKLSLLYVYFTEIKGVYETVPLQLKDSFLDTLEQIVLALEQNPNLGANVKFRSNIYDPTKAIELRMKAGLSGVELGKSILASYRQIYRYESGTHSPKPTTRVGRKYLLWLKEQGYNPYKL